MGGDGNGLDDPLLHPPRLRQTKQQRLESFREKRKPLCFTGITVTAPEVGAGVGARLFHKLRSSLPQPLRGLLPRKANQPITAVKEISGILRPSETCLVLGAPLSGKTSLLRALSGRLNPLYDELGGGPVSLGGEVIDPSSPHYKRAAAFVSANDTEHSATLTVKETFAFAAACSRTYDPKQAEQLDGLVGAVESELDLAHVRNTVVGGEELRGISGGQKRRVTFGEMAFAAERSFLFLDNITNGLDCISAGSIVELVSRTAKSGGFGAMMTLLQPPQKVYDMFDTVLVLNHDGTMAFFGPRKEAVPFFEEATGMQGGPGVTSATFIQSCVAPGHPTVCFEGSKQHTALRHDLARTTQSSRYPWETIKHAGEEMPLYANSPWMQFRICLWRRSLLVRRNPMTVRRPIVAILFGLVTGTLYSATTNDLMGSISTSGFCFLSLFLVLMLAGAVTLPENYRQRTTFFKHREAYFFSTSAHYWAAYVMDLPLMFVEALLLAGVPYFFVGLRNDASHFCYFALILLALEFVGQAWGRFISAACPSQVMANLITAIWIFVCSLVAGYLPQYAQIGWWWRWLSWVTPVSYAFEGVMLHEFGSRLVPLASFANDEGHRASFGALPGDALLGWSFQLPRIPFDEMPLGVNTIGNLMLFDLLMIFVLSLALDCLAVATLQWSISAHGTTVRRRQHTVSKRQTKLPTLQDTKTQSSGTVTSLVVRGLTYDVSVVEDDKPLLKGASGSFTGKLYDSAPSCASTIPDSCAEEYNVPTTPCSPEDDDDSLISAGTPTLEEGSPYAAFHVAGQEQQLLSMTPTPPKGGDVWQALGSDLAAKPQARETGACLPRKKKPRGHLRLLNDVTALFEAGRMAALMGESGAGKTTLLDVVANYKTGGTTGGGIYINGQKATPSSWKSIGGYCEQNDIHNPYLSVQESLMFAARCRLPASISWAEKKAIVESILTLVGLRDYANILVGSELEGTGLPKHARKLLTIGVELVTNPSILFLDEPTTGLDDESSRVVLSAVRRSTDRFGLIVVATLHQPSRSLFEMFDDFLLLKKGGRMAYCGPLGKNSEALVSYLATLHPTFVMDHDENPADFVLGICEGSHSPVDTVAAFADSKECEALRHKVATVLMNPAPLAQRGARPHQWKQFLLVAERQFTAQVRNQSYSGMRMFWTVFGGVMIGTLFLQVEHDLEGAILVIAACFFAVYVAVVPMQAAVVPLVAERAVMFREVSSGTYTRLAYSIGNIAADLPLHLLTAFIFAVLFYFTVGMRSGVEHLAYFAMMIGLTYWILPSIGQLMALICPNVETANGLSGLCIILSTMTMGFLIIETQMPHSWQWAYWANALRYPMQGVVCNELAGQSYPVNATQILTSISFEREDARIKFRVPHPRSHHEATLFLNAGGLAPALKRGFRSEDPYYSQLFGDTMETYLQQSSPQTSDADELVDSKDDYVLSCLFANDCLDSTA
ncbi:unnamed protein product, partial [Chrysoparadoxa australica]